jgi:hypothetical protein
MGMRAFIMEREFGKDRDIRYAESEFKDERRLKLRVMRGIKAYTEKGRQ